MKKLKYVKTFENFKPINEEGPYNYGAAERFFNPKWTEKEYSDLEELGADEIDDNTAIFKEKGGSLIITVKKKSSNETRSLNGIEYTADSNVPRTRDVFSTGITVYEWNKFLKKLDNFIRNDGFFAAER